MLLKHGRIGPTCSRLTSAHVQWRLTRSPDASLKAFFRSRSSNGETDSGEGRTVVVFR
jgi:hypothetical protein